MPEGLKQGRGAYNMGFQAYVGGLYGGLLRDQKRGLEAELLLLVPPVLSWHCGSWWQYLVGKL